MDVPSRQTKSPANFNMLHMFKNITYTDFKTANKHVLTPTYHFSDLTESICHKTKLFKT